MKKKSICDFLVFHIYTVWKQKGTYIERIYTDDNNNNIPV